LVTLEALRKALIELDETRTLELTRELLAHGDATPLSILSTCQQALKVVGERYEREEYYISGLIMAGELFNEVLDIAQPLYGPVLSEDSLGTIVLGTVARDIHDIGKNLFANSLLGFGFEVTDLGVDVPAEKFLAEVERSRPDVVCLSGLILAAFESMKETVALLRAHETELGYRPPVVLGGAIIDGRVCDFCGADSWSTDAMEGVRICQDLVSRASGRRPRTSSDRP
jgi:dimethylamine corrinoid protein